MKQLFKALTALGAALVIVFAVRAFMFTVYKVPANIGSMLHKGDRVLVNKLSHAPLHIGDWVVFSRNGDYVGRIEALPGDTLTVGGRHYLIPTQCCSRCTCPYCQLYMVDTGQERTLVYRHQMVGKGYRLFHLPF